MLEPLALDTFWGLNDDETEPKLLLAEVHHPVGVDGDVAVRLSLISTLFGGPLDNWLLLISLGLSRASWNAFANGL